MKKILHWFTSKRVAILAALFVPAVGASVVVYYFLWHGLFCLLFNLAFFKWRAWGITAGYHRYQTHHSYTPIRAIKILIIAGGEAGMQGPAGPWVGNHRSHHKESGKKGDPHRPNEFGDGWFASIRGFFWAQVGWIILSPTAYDTENLGDPDDHLGRDLDVMWMDRHYWIFVLISLFLPPVVFAFVEWFFWQEPFLVAFGYGFAWNLLCIFCVQQFTYLVNSIAHMLGSQPVLNKGSDTSRNVWWLAFLTGGEGWHLWHHFCEWSARHGLEWWQWDDTYYLIWFLGKLGLVKDIRVASKAMIEKGKQEKKDFDQKLRNALTQSAEV